METDGTWLYGGLCGDQLYSDEPLLDPGAGATAFWVGKDVFVTAGHVVKANTDPTTNSGIACKDVQVVFDYDIASFNTTTGTPDVAVIKKKQNTVYDCVDVLGNVKLPQGDPKLGHNEWTVFRVDRVVTGHHPLRVLPSGQPSVNEPVAIIGHGLGLPKKFDDGAFVKSVSATNGELTFSGDVFPGNSGGPIISLTTGYVVGMVAGNPPFQALTPGTDTWGTCYRYKPGCSTSSGCPGFPTGPLLNQSSIKSLLPTQQTGLYGDFDFDGQLDSVAVEPNAFGTLNVKVTSSSAGTFYFPTFIPASFGSLSALQVGDFNQDQYFDIIAHVNGLDPVYIDGGATLGLNISNSPYLAFQGFKSVVVRDINSDSAEDLVAVRDDGSRQYPSRGPRPAQRARIRVVQQHVEGRAASHGRGVEPAPSRARAERPDTRDFRASPWDSRRHAQVVALATGRRTEVVERSRSHEASSADRDSAGARLGDARAKRGDAGVGARGSDGA